MTQEELNLILEKHKKWLNYEKDGERADLTGANLTGVNLKGVNLDFIILENAILEDAILEDANLNYANLENANLEGANLRSADLYGARLICANLKGANLDSACLELANLYDANLYNANLQDTNLQKTNLHSANLHNAYLVGANLYNTKLDNKEQYKLGEIVAKGFYGYKQCQNGIIVKLFIPEGSVVFGINGKDFRTNKAECVDVIGDNIGVSIYDNDFVYEIGKTYIINDFDLLYNVECGKGIHFFKTIEEAKEYEI